MKILTLMFLLSTFVSAKAQLGFKEKGSGHYRTTSGEKVEGEFKLSYKSNLSGSIIKHYINGKKVGRVDLVNLQSLVMTGDSFIIATNFTLDNWASYDRDLVKVLNEGKINLFLHSRKVKQSTYNTIPVSYLVESYVIQKENSGTYIGIATKGQFESYFMPLIEDDEALTREVLAMKKGDWVKTLPYLIKKYNQQL